MQLRVRRFLATYYDPAAAAAAAPGGGRGQPTYMQLLREVCWGGGLGAQWEAGQHTGRRLRRRDQPSPALPARARAARPPHAPLPASSNPFRW
jgi:hypothetical protein